MNHASSVTASPARSTQIKAGLAALVLALVLGLLMTLHPERLRAPAWVGVLACGSFGAAGASLVAKGCGRNRIAQACVCLLLAAFVAMTSWVAFGSGARTCGVRLATGLAWIRGAGACRGAFGVGAVLLGGMLGLAVRELLRGTRRQPAFDSDA